VSRSTAQRTTDVARAVTDVLQLCDVLLLGIGIGLAAAGLGAGTAAAFLFA
jgi:hypothetical protein